MKNSWIIIIDNGYDYSDHSHAVLAVCNTEAQADEAIKAFNDWKAALDAETNGEYYDDLRVLPFVKVCPCPFSTIEVGRTSNPNFIWSLNEGDTVDKMEVPKWAKDKK